jgi:hypothetical protein
VVKGGAERIGDFDGFSCYQRHGETPRINGAPRLAARTTM